MKQHQLCQDASGPLQWVKHVALPLGAAGQQVTCSPGVEGTILLTLGIPTWDRTLSALGSPAQIFLLTQTDPRDLWGTSW